MKPIVIGIDPSLTATGWCAWDAEHPSTGYLGSGVVHGPAADRADRDPDETQDVLERLKHMELKLQRHIDAVVGHFDDRDIHYVVEADLQSGTRRGKRPYNSMDRYHFACAFIARALGASRLVAPMTWKGTDSKTAAILMASDLIGRKLAAKDSDEADAICIAHHEVSRLGLLTRGTS